MGVLQVHIGITSGQPRKPARPHLYLAALPETLIEARESVFLRGIPMPIVATLTDSGGPIEHAVVEATIAMEVPPGSMRPGQVRQRPATLCDAAVWQVARLSVIIDTTILATRHRSSRLCRTTRTRDPAIRNTASAGVRILL